MVLHVEVLMKFCLGELKTRATLLHDLFLSVHSLRVPETPKEAGGFAELRVLN